MQGLYSRCDRCHYKSSGGGGGGGGGGVNVYETNMQASNCMLQVATVDQDVFLIVVSFSRWMW